MKLSRLADYAMRICVDLTLHAGEQPDIKSLAERQKAPAHYLAKIVQQLSRAGIVSTRRGTHGGIRLAVPPATLTLRRVWEAVEGPINFAKCQLWPEECAQHQTCPYHNVLQGLGDVVTGYLDAITVASLAEQAAATGGAG